MTRRSPGPFALPPLLAASLACAAMIAPGGALANPGMGGPQSQPQGGGEGHDHGPSGEDMRDARDRAARGAAEGASDVGAGITTIRQRGGTGGDLSAQIGATAAAEAQRAAAAGDIPGLPAYLTAAARNKRYDEEEDFWLVINMRNGMPMAQARQEAEKFVQQGRNTDDKDIQLYSDLLQALQKRGWQGDAAMQKARELLDAQTPKRFGGR